MALQVAALVAVYESWIGGIRVPVTNSAKYKFCKRGKGHGDSVWAKPTFGCLSYDVLGQPQWSRAGLSQRSESSRLVTKPLEDRAAQEPH